MGLAWTGLTCEKCRRTFTGRADDGDRPPRFCPDHADPKRRVADYLPKVFPSCDWCGLAFVGKASDPEVCLECRSAGRVVGQRARVNWFGTLRAFVWLRSWWRWL